VDRELGLGLARAINGDGKAAGDVGLLGLFEEDVKVVTFGVTVADDGAYYIKIGYTNLFKIISFIFDL
jgi:hypothetical protein